MKFSNWVLSTGVVFGGLSLGLFACGSGSSSPNPGIGGAAGAVSSVPASCPNPIQNENTGGIAVSDVRNIPPGRYTLSSLETYVYDPGNGGSFSARAEAPGFDVRLGKCNEMNEPGRDTEQSSLMPESLDSFRENGQNDQERSIMVKFLNGQAFQATSWLQNDQSGASAFGHMGRGRELFAPNTYISYQFFLMPDGRLELQTEMEMPINPATGQSKLVFTAAEYEAQAPARPGGPERPGNPGRPGR